MKCFQNTWILVGNSNVETITYYPLSLPRSVVSGPILSSHPHPLLPLPAPNPTVQGEANRHLMAGSCVLVVWPPTHKGPLAFFPPSSFLAPSSSICSSLSQTTAPSRPFCPTIPGSSWHSAHPSHWGALLSSGSSPLRLTQFPRTFSCQLHGSPALSLSPLPFSLVSSFSHVAFPFSSLVSPLCQFPM